MAGRAATVALTQPPTRIAAIVCPARRIRILPRGRRDVDARDLVNSATDQRRTRHQSTRNRRPTRRTFTLSAALLRQRKPGHLVPPDRADPELFSHLDGHGRE